MVGVEGRLAVCGAPARDAAVAGRAASGGPGLGPGPRERYGCWDSLSGFAFGSAGNTA